MYHQYREWTVKSIRRNIAKNFSHTVFSCKFNQLNIYIYCILTHIITWSTAVLPVSVYPVVYKSQQDRGAPLLFHNPLPHLLLRNERKSKEIMKGESKGITEGEGKGKRMDHIYIHTQNHAHAHWKKIEVEVSAALNMNAHQLKQEFKINISYCSVRTRNEFIHMTAAAAIDVRYFPVKIYRLI